MTGGVLRVVLGDQLSPGIAALDGLDPAQDTVLLMEVLEECTTVPHHPQKIALILSAMRHFSRALAARGVRVDHIRLDDPANTGSFSGEVLRAARRHRPAAIVVTEPGEWRVAQDIAGWEAATGVPVEMREDTRFLCTHTRFAGWAAGRRSLRMEFFYREMRRDHGLLLDADGVPAGGEWNFDADNRKPLPKGVAPPGPPAFPPDAITQEVLDLVAARFPDHFGTLAGFNWPVTGQDARTALQCFIRDRLPLFGDYQDAMARGQPTLFHALISTSLNCGLLDPLEACRAAETAFHAGQAPLNAVEGFIRQILGWREYVRGIYWLKMPAYRDTNALGAVRSLPDFYWGAPTGMACMTAAVGQTRDLAYAHHIQRLMVTGNFALLAGIAPGAINDWYLAVYADAYEWVELPNTHGMAIHADGGMMASKPYAASGAYINRMSDYCGACAHDVKDAVGERACPFNFLYWDFIARHAERFENNPRMAMPVRGLRNMLPEKVKAMRDRARAFLDAVAPLV
ncbi:cryptochrome/photolyase family protein [Humitalea sp. 24SJ18S-53]|uniref:cryptochrome/photolyase family protein n=1 Tax=Humitalea sp. 24SJ18S-53 TaxID=3422307 RepID=UPI003D66D834